MNRVEQKVAEELGENIIQEGKEMLRRANIHKIHTIYFGGGTPSLMKPQDIQVHDHSVLCSCGSYGISLSHLFGKNFVKATSLQKKS